MEPGWDKEMTRQLVREGIDWDKARIIVGIIAEQRQIADRQGYIRGYNDGFSKGTLTNKRKTIKQE